MGDDLQLEAQNPVPGAGGRVLEYEGRAEDVAKSMGLARRSFFRWLSVGQEHGDLLPCRDLSLVPAWYERMRERGAFKHRFPSDVAAACARWGGAAKCAKTDGAGEPPKEVGAPGAEQSVPTVKVGVMGRMLATEDRRGLAYEIEQLERMISASRRAAEADYASQDDDGGKRKVAHMMEMLDKVTTLKQRLDKIEETAELTVRKEWVEQDLAAIVPAALANWRAEGGKMYALSKTTLPRAEFLAMWDGSFRRFCMALVQSRFAPPMELEAA